MTLSVVIPTFNRLPILREVLAALDGAARPAGDFEAILISDGSSDGTDAFLAAWQPRHRFRWEAQPNQGPGRARNRGAELARGERMLFLGDDTVPAEDLLVRHQERAAAEGGAVAVLGYTRWHARMRVTPFLEYINEMGLQFGYSIIPDPTDVPFNFFYTSNISLPRALFLELGGFDSEFPSAAWEDIEFAYRATRQGLRIVYEPRALAAHDHPTDARRFARRQAGAGRSAAVFARKHPELSHWLGLEDLQGLQPLWRRRLELALVRLGDVAPFFFSSRLAERAMRQAYLGGLAEVAGNGAGAAQGLSS